MLTPDQNALESGESPDTPGDDVAAAATGSSGKDDRPASPASGRPGRRSAPPQLDFPPVRNGIDYLTSVIEHLDEEESEVGPRDLKYAVLHLQAAVEVLLKARLLQEHWSLVFKDPGRATREKYESGGFESCGTDAAVARLRDIVGVRFDKKETDALNALADDRNALQHYGLTHSAAAVETRAGRVLDFLMGFLNEHLLPQLSGPEAEAARRDMSELTLGVTNISSYVKRRLNRLRGELKGLERQTIPCPMCAHRTFVTAPGGGTCRFCGTSWSSGELFVRFYRLALGKEPDGSGELCPQCSKYALEEGVPFTDDPTAIGTLFCFSCTARYTREELINCTGCSRSWPLEADVDGGDAHLCTDCLSRADPEEIG